MARFWKGLFDSVTGRNNVRFGRPAKKYDPNTRRLPNVIRQKEQREERERQREQERLTGEPDYRFNKTGEAGRPGNSRYSRLGDPEPLPIGSDETGEQEHIWSSQGANDQEIDTLEELHNRFNTWPSYENWLAYAEAQEDLGMRPDWAEFREKYEGSLA